MLYYVKYGCSKNRDNFMIVEAKKFEDALQLAMDRAEKEFNSYDQSDLINSDDYENYADYWDEYQDVLTADINYSAIPFDKNNAWHNTVLREQGVYTL